MSSTYIVWNPGRNEDPCINYHPFTIVADTPEQAAESMTELRYGQWGMPSEVYVMVKEAGKSISTAKRYSVIITSRPVFSAYQYNERKPP